MKTVQQLVNEVEAELNAVRAADMGLEAAEAFALEAQQAFSSGDVVATGSALQNLIGLLAALRKAVPANVIPATAGPVGKTPREQYIEAAADVAKTSMEGLASSLVDVQALLHEIGKAIEAATIAVAAVKQVPAE